MKIPMNANDSLWWADDVSERLLMTVGVVALVVLTAGCMGILSDSDDREDQVEKVPEDADLLVHMDMALLADSETQELLEGLDEEEADEVDDADDIFEEFEAETGLDLAEANQVLIFGSMADDIDDPDFDADEEFGILLDADWDVEDLVETIEAEGEFEFQQTEFAGEEVLWEPTTVPEGEDELYIGVHDDDQIVLGVQSAVEASLAISYDDAEPVSGPVREAFEDAQDGFITFAIGMDDAAGTGDPMVDQQLAMVDGMTAMSGTYYTTSGSVGVEMRMHFEENEQAEDIEGGINMMLSEFEHQMDPQEQEMLDALDITTEGSALVITWEDSVQNLLELSEDA